MENFWNKLKEENKYEESVLNFFRKRVEGDMYDDDIMMTKMRDFWRSPGAISFEKIIAYLDKDLFNPEIRDFKEAQEEAAVAEVTSIHAPLSTP